jgi:hypothetical protein
MELAVMDAVDDSIVHVIRSGTSISTRNAGWSVFTSVTWAVAGATADPEQMFHVEQLKRKEL